MAASVADRLHQLGYARTRRLLLATGSLVLGAVVVVMYVRRVDGVEVVATLLFVPIFLAFLYKGILGGLVAAVGAAVAYAAMRAPAIEAVGAGHFAGLLTARSAAYLAFGLAGGWASQSLYSSIRKLDLYDEVDDETGLYNARHLLRQTSLELARAERYRTLFSLAVLDVPAGALARIPARRRRALLAELGHQLGEGVRTVDHVVHARDGARHRLVAILPETASEGAELFRHRFTEAVLELLRGRGVAVQAAELASGTITIPGDEERLERLRADFARIDAGAQPAR